MNHAEWVTEYRQVLGTTGSRDETRTALNRLLRKTRRAAKAGITDWHEGQLLGALAEESGEPEAALRAYRKLADLYRQQLNQYGHSLASALESAGLVALQSGNWRTATRITKEVVRLRAIFPDSTTAYRKLVSAIDDAGDIRHKSSRRLKGRTRED